MKPKMIRTSRHAEEFFPFMCWGGIRKLCGGDPVGKTG